MHTVPVIKGEIEFYISWISSNRILKDSTEFLEENASNLNKRELLINFDSLKDGRM